MTEPTETAEPSTAVDGSADVPVPNGTPEPTANQPEERTPDDKEAARYRHRLRAAEGERDAVAARLEVMQRGEAERLAASKLADPQDLWRDGAALADVLDDAGHIDPAKLDAMIGTVLDAHKHWAKQTHPAAAPASSVTANGKIHGGEAPKTWAQVLNPNTAPE